VFDGDSAPPQKIGTAFTQFVVHVYCGQTAGWMQLVLGMEVGLSPGDFMLDGDPASSLKRGRSPLPNFRSISIVVKRLDASRCHLVGLSPGNFVLHGDPVPLQKRGRSLQFSAHVYCGQTAAWIKMPEDIVLDGDPAPPPEKAAEPLPNFRLMSIVANS